MFAGLISPLFPSCGLNKKPGTIFFDGDSPAILSPAVYKKGIIRKGGETPCFIPDTNTAIIQTGRRGRDLPAHVLPVVVTFPVPAE
jgi:hypothetical protein